MTHVKSGTGLNRFVGLGTAVDSSIVGLQNGTNATKPAGQDVGKN
jgi:hypothetical protein